MKATGPIPPGFGRRDGELVIAGRKVSEIVEQAGGTPLFVYDAGLIEQRIADLRAQLPASIALHYAVKANPFAPLVEHMAALVDGFDIASGGELRSLVAQGIDPARISFAGPGKRDAELAAAISAQVTINCESEGEARRILDIGERLGKTPRVALRVNPDFELRGSGMKMGGGAKPFGIDHDRAARLARELIAAGIEWRGLHLFAGSQSLDTAAIIEAQAQTLALAGQIAEEIGRPLPALNMGGGFGIPYFAGDTPIDAAAIGAALAQQIDGLHPLLREARLCLELGRYLVGEAGVYLARIVDRKLSHGSLFLVTDGGLHHQLAASGNFGTVVRRNYPVAIASRMDDPACEEAHVVGCLCTPLDRLADAIGVPRAEVGDLVAVFCAGAYGASASPVQFLGHGPAGEILLRQGS